ncbi:hypothetical protein [Actinoallomurus acaciae]|uniref:Amino acid permease/ SLC12A domain-containing protein n=1 Tax=Actinoallomurus acaciae TaxID=502577 RepID=A0ABV5YGP2_9ACTN
MTAATDTPRAPGGEESRHLRRDIGRIGLLFTGVGSIIGSGWLFGAMNAGIIAGPAAIFSWAIACSTPPSGTTSPTSTWSTVRRCTR